jgi:hypothetical protein
MKKILLTLAMVAAFGATVFGQGRIGFDNVGGGGPVTVGAQNQGVAGGVAGAYLGATYSIQLVWAPQGVYADQAAFNAAVLGSSTAVAFFGVTGIAPAHGPSADGAGLWDGGNVAVPVGNYTVQARAWYNNGANATYAAAVLAGVNTGVSAFQNIASTAAPTPANFTSFPAFTVGTPVPEPGTLALAGLGAASLLLFRRKK